MDYKDGLRLLACFKLLDKPREVETETEQDFRQVMENLSVDMCENKGKFSRKNNGRDIAFNICVDHYNEIQDRGSSFGPPIPKPNRSGTMSKFLTVELTDGDRTLMSSRWNLARYDAAWDVAGNGSYFTLRIIEQPVGNEVLARRLYDVGFQVGVLNIFTREGMNTLRDLTNMTQDDILEIKGLAHGAIQHINDVLSDLGLSLKGGNT